MGMTYSVDNDFVTVIADGGFGIAEVHRTFSEIRSGCHNDAPLRILIVDHGSQFEPSREEILELTQEWSSLFRNIPVRIALLVERDIHYGLGRMLSVYAEQHDLPFNVFRHSLDAMRWLADSEETPYLHA
jgi:hypothetical protein